MPEGREVEQVINISPRTAPTPDVPFVSSALSIYVPMQRLISDLRPQRNPILIGQNYNEAILREHLAKYGTHVELGVPLVGFTQDSDGVTAELVHLGTNDQETQETIRVQYLVGAEGARSTLTAFGICSLIAHFVTLRFRRRPKAARN